VIIATGPEPAIAAIVAAASLFFFLSLAFRARFQR